GDVDDLARLNRRMMVSLVRGTALDATSVFRPKNKTLIRQVTRWQDHEHFAAYTQFVGQLSSLGEYLMGHSAAADRRERFRQFLKDLDPKTPADETFERDFGFGVDELLERWRAWVKEQGTGVHLPPPVAVRDT